MLLIKASARPSKINGIGLFADQEIPKGTQIWKFNQQFDRIFDESFERIGKSKFVISHDTYPIHLASLLSIPVLGIYFSTDPVIWGSYLNEYKYISSPLACFGRKQGTGNCSHFHTTCPNIDEIKKSITVEQVVFEGVRMIEKITQKS